MPRVLEIQINPDILIWGVCARIGIAHARSRDGQSQFVNEGMARSRPADQRDEDHRFFVDILCRIHDKFDERVIGIGARGTFFHRLT